MKKNKAPKAPSFGAFWKSLPLRRSMKRSMRNAAKYIRTGKKPHGYRSADDVNDEMKKWVEKHAG